MSAHTRNFPYRFVINNQPPFGNFSVAIGPGINYLIGKNGSGKSKFIEAFLKGNGAIQTNLGVLGKTQTRRVGGGVQIVRKGQATIIRYQSAMWNKTTFDPIAEMQSDYEKVNGTFDLLSQQHLEVSKETEEVDHFIDDQGKPKTRTITSNSHKIRGEELIDPKMLSDGTNNMFSIVQFEAVNISGFHMATAANAQKPPLILTLDEPEVNLHPELERKLPQIIHQKFMDFRKRFPRKEIFIIVATHSPFILKGVAEFKKDTRVFLLPTIPNSESISGILEPISPTQAIIDGNMNLGVSIEDFLPQKLLIAENSIAVLIKKIEENLDLDTPSFFVTNTGGDSNLETRIASIFGVNKMLKSISKNYPDRHLFKMSYTIFADDEEFKEKLEKQWADVNETDLKLEVINVGKNCLEDSYPLEGVNAFIKTEFPDKKEWDGEQSINQFLHEELGLNNKEKGEFKARLAIHIAGKINSKEDLKKLFPQLYDFLIPA